MAAHVCHVYGYSPRQLLDMPWRHFLLLAGHIDINERRRARYTALAFNDPQKLFDGEPAAHKVCDAAELLAACNGRQGVK